MGEYNHLLALETPPVPGRDVVQGGGVAVPRMILESVRFTMRGLEARLGSVR